VLQLLRPKKLHPWSLSQDGDLKMLSSPQVTHFRRVAEVKQQKSLFDEDSDFTGPLPPPKVEDGCAHLPKVVKVAVCETSANSTASSAACSSSSSSLFDDETKNGDAGEEVVLASGEERHRQEAELMQEMFHDLTYRCFTPSYSSPV